VDKLSDKIFEDDLSGGILPSETVDVERGRVVRIVGRPGTGKAEMVRSLSGEDTLLVYTNEKVLNAFNWDRKIVNPGLQGSRSRAYLRS